MNGHVDLGIGAEPPSARRQDAYFASLMAPPGQRSSLALVWELEDRLATILPHAEEAHIPLIKLAWWRDTLAELGKGRHAGEPLLERIQSDLPTGTYPLLAGLAEAHMDRIEHGDDIPAVRALLIAGSHICGVSPDWIPDRTSDAQRVTVPKAVRPFSAVLAAAPVRHRSPTRRHVAMLAHNLTGRMTVRAEMLG